MNKTIRQENIARVRKIKRHLRPPTLPVGIKFWKNGERIANEAGKSPEYNYTWCQFLSNARFGGGDKRDIVLVRKENLTCNIAPGVLGFEVWPEKIKDGTTLARIHFESKEVAATAMKLVPHTPVNTEAITVGALEELEVEPDVIVIAVTPGRCNKAMDGAMWYKGGDFSTHFSNGCGICAFATAKPYIDRDAVAHITFPCHGARRFGGWRDDELACGVRIDQFDIWVKGMENTSKTGHSYPIPHQLNSQLRESHHVITETPYEELYPYCIRH